METLGKTRYWPCTNEPLGEDFLSHHSKRMRSFNIRIPWVRFAMGTLPPAPSSCWLSVQVACRRILSWAMKCATSHTCLARDLTLYRCLKIVATHHHSLKRCLSQLGVGLHIQHKLVALLKSERHERRIHTSAWFLHWMVIVLLCLTKLGWWSSFCSNALQPSRLIFSFDSRTIGLGIFTIL